MDESKALALVGVIEAKLKSLKEVISGKEVADEETDDEDS